MSDPRKAVGLPNRGVVKVSGEETRDFLDRLITADMSRLVPGTAIHAALLTPQGKIITDFMVSEADEEDGGGFYCDLPLVAAGDLVKRLTLYKLRARVRIEDLSDALGVMAVWGGTLPDIDSGLTCADPRVSTLGLRVIGHKSQSGAIREAFGVKGTGSEDDDLAAYHQHRANHGIGEAGFDFHLNETFPHEINMDQLGGVDFKKGCYIGQEVVSRMQHRGTARTRLVPLKTGNGLVLAENLPVLVEDRPIGFTGTGGKGLNLGLIRLDKAADAILAGKPIMAGAVEVMPTKPAWWVADWPFGHDKT